MSAKTSFARTKSQEGGHKVGPDVDSVQRALIESAHKPVAVHIRSSDPAETNGPRETPLRMLSPRLDSMRVDTRSPPRFDSRPHSPITQSKPNILRLGSHRRVFSDDISFSTIKPDPARRSSLGGDPLMMSPNATSPGMGRRSSLNDSLLRRQYSNSRPEMARPVSLGDSYNQNRRSYFSTTPTEVQKPAMTKSQSAECVPRREYQVRIVKGPQAYDPAYSPARSPEGRSDSESSDSYMRFPERSISPDESKKASRVVVSIPETLIAKIQQALKDAGDEGLSCAQLMNTPSCKRLRFPCTLQGATPGSILRELPCVRHDNKRYYYVEPGTSAPPASSEFSHRRLPSRAESIGEVSESPLLQYSPSELMELRNVIREETEFDILLKEKLFLLGLLPGGETDDDSSHRSRSSVGAPLLESTPVLAPTPLLTRRESAQSVTEPMQSPPFSPIMPGSPPELQTMDSSSEVQEFARMLQFYKTHNFCIDSAARVNESAAALLTLLSKCGDIPQALYGPGVFPLVRRIYEKTKETPFWSECRASVHQVITTALQLPQNSSSQQSWLMRFLLGCEASTEERSSNQACSSEWGSLTQEIMGEIALLNPGESLRIRQQGAIERMGVLGKTIKLGLQVFGPVAFGLASILSDVHLQTVGGPKTDAVRSLFSLLQESPQYRNVQMVRPGMIQCFDLESALSVTVCCHSRQEYKVASEMTALVLAYRSLDSRFEMLFHMVSKWAQMSNLIDEVEGLSLWGWILLVVHYLQSIPSRILPVLDCFVPSTPSSFKTRRDSSPSIAASSILALAAQTAPNSEAASTNSWSSTNTDCIGELLVGFFTRYGAEFNPETQCVSVRMGTFLDATEYRATLRALDPSFAPTPHPYISVASPAHVALAYTSQPKSALADAKSTVVESSKIFDSSSKSTQDDKASSPVLGGIKVPTAEAREVEATSSSEAAKPGIGSPKKGTHADLKSTELEQVEADGSKRLSPSSDSKFEGPPRASTPPPTSISEVSIKQADTSVHGSHRKTPSLTTISEVAKPSNLTPSSATRSLTNTTTRPKNCEHALCVEDPFRPTENVAMNTPRAALRRIQEALDVARTTLLSHAPLRQIFVIGTVEEKLPQIEV